MSSANEQMRESLERQLDDYTKRNVDLVMENQRLRKALEQIAEAVFALDSPAYRLVLIAREALAGATE